MQNDNQPHGLGARTMRHFPPSSFKEALGHICVNSAKLESTLMSVIWTAAGLDEERGMALTGGERVSDLIKTLKLLIKIRHPNLTDITVKLTGELKTQFNRRGDFVHGQWAIGLNNQPLVGKYFTASVLKEGKLVALDEMYDLAESFLLLEGLIVEQILMPMLESNQSSTL
jgi:hypothetical protein